MEPWIDELRQYAEAGGSLLRDLRASGFQVMLSLELSNRQYWKEDPLTVARTGLQKMKALVGASEQESS